VRLGAESWRVWARTPTRQPIWRSALLCGLALRFWVGAAVLGWRCGFGLALRFWVGAAVLGWRYGFIRHGAETPGWDCGQGDLHDDVRYHDA